MTATVSKQKSNSNEALAQLSAQEKTQSKVSKTKVGDTVKSITAKAPRKVESETSKSEKSIANEEQQRKSKLEYRNQMSLDEAVAYFEAIVDGLKNKKIEFHKDDETISLKPQEQIVVEVKASAKGERSKVSFKMSWSEFDPAKLTIKSKD